MQAAAARRSCSLASNCRISVPDARFIGYARMRVLIRKQRVIERALLALGDFAVCPGEVAESESLRRTGGLTGRHNFSNRLIVAICDNSRFRDALQAEGALFHDPARADSHVGIEGLRRSAVLLRKGEIVEPADLVRTIVGAKPRSDAAIVDHDVEPF